MGRLLLVFINGESTRETLIVAALLQLVIDRDTAIEDEALTLPARVVLWYLLKVI
jgi:hypothetical protein